MKRPYNNDRSRLLLWKNQAKAGLLLILATIMVATTSCGKGTPSTEEHFAARPSTEVIAEANRLYVGRPDLVKIRQGVAALRQAQAGDQSNYELAWRLAMFDYYLGAHTPESTERDKAFRNGIENGKLAVKLEDGKPEGHFWLGANYGGSAKASVLAGLTEFDDIKREMETVIKLDEGYHAGSAYMALGQLYLEAPRFLGGDTQKAIQYLEKGSRLGPENALLRANLADAYAEAHRNEDARKQIDAVLAMKPSPGFEAEQEEALAQVRKLQEKIK